MTSRRRAEGQTEKTDEDVFESWHRGGWGGHPGIMRIKGKNRRKREKDGAREADRQALKASDAYIFKCTNCFQRAGCAPEPRRGTSKQLNTSNFWFWSLNRGPEQMLYMGSLKLHWTLTYFDAQYLTKMISPDKGAKDDLFITTYFSKLSSRLLVMIKVFPEIWERSDSRRIEVRRGTKHDS